MTKKLFHVIVIYIIVINAINVMARMKNGKKFKVRIYIFFVINFSGQIG